MEMQANILAYMGIIFIGGSFMFVYDSILQVAISMPTPIYFVKDGDIEVSLPVSTDGSVNVKINVAGSESSITAGNEVHTGTTSSKSVFNYSNKRMSPLQHAAMSKSTAVSVTNFINLSNKEQFICRTNDEMQAAGLSSDQISKLQASSGANVNELAATKSSRHIDAFSSAVNDGNTSEATSLILHKPAQLRREGETAVTGRSLA